MKVRVPWALYLILAATAGSSFLAASLLPTTALLKEMAATPGVGAMFGVLVMVMRNYSDYQQQLALQNSRLDVELATASHMANTVFDRHAAFCEEYIAKMVEIMSKFFQDGPSSKGLAFANELGMIRVKHATWLTREIDAQLISLEQYIRQIGIKEIQLEALQVGEKRTEVVMDVYNKLLRLIGAGPAKEKGESEEIAMADVIEDMRRLLGVSELTAIRKSAIQAAKERIKA